MSTSKKKVVTKKPNVTPTQKTIEEPKKPSETELLLKKIEDLEKKLEKQEKVEIPSLEPTQDEKIEKLRLKDRKLIPGTFRFHDIKDGGGHIKFNFKKWPGDPVEAFLLVDGHRYALPKGVVDHLNKNCKYVTKPGNVLLGQSAQAKAHRRTSFERDDIEDVKDIEALDKGYAPSNSR